MNAVTVPSQLVEHRCYQCGADVEDGTAFCRQCSAPQIRVITATTLPSDQISPNARSEGVPSFQPVRHGRADWTPAAPAALLGLLIAIALSTVVPGALAVGLLSAGFLSVYFYRRRHRLVRLTMGLGARLGALSGLLGFGITVIASTVATTVSHSEGEIHKLALDAMRQQASRSSDPEMQKVLDFCATREGFITMLVLGIIVMFFIFLALSGVGGMIGAAILRKKDSI